MNLVNKENYVRIFLELLNNGAQPLLKLAAVFGTGHNGSHVERQDTLAKEHT